MKNWLSIIIFLISLNLLGALTEKENMMLRVLDKEQLQTKLKKIIKGLQEQEKENSVIPTAVLIHRVEIRRYQEHPFVEADTGLQRKWYTNMLKSIENLGKIKKKQKHALITKDKKNFNLCNQLFKKELGNFIKISKTPTKVDRRRLLSLRKAARKKRREIEKKLQKEGIKIEKAATTQNNPDRRPTRDK